MDIPIVYTVFKARSLQIGAVEFEEGIPIIDKNALSPLPKFSKGKEDCVILTDVRGFSKKSLDDRVLKGTRGKGNNILYLTHVEFIEDVLDSFMGNIERLLIPVHTVKSFDLIDEAYQLSENCTPVIFSSGGLGLSPKNQKKNITELIDILMSIGYSQIFVFDIDNSVTEKDWIEIYEKYSNVIPYCHKNSERLRKIGFKDIIVDLDF